MAILSQLSGRPRIVRHMKHTFLTAIGALAAAASLSAAPAASMAQTQSDAKTYTTILTENGPMQLGGYFTGTLEITISSDGIVNGWYIPDYRSFVSVTGSDKNGKLWLNVGDAGRLQIRADIQKDGRIVGSAIQLSRLPGDMSRPNTFDFVAQPKTT